jgi:hypothetical protein
MFQSSGIKEIDISLPVVTDLSYFAYANKALKKVNFRKLNTNGFKAIHCFNADTRLEEVIYDGTINVIGDSSYMYLNNHNLKKVPVLNLDNSTKNTRLFENSHNLTNIELLNIKENINIKALRLNRTKLINIFNNLVDMGEERTINITGCFGAKELTDEDIATATSKNWTVIK